MSDLTPAINKNAKILMIFAVVCTAIVGTVQLLTKDRIKEQEKQQLKAQLNAIVPISNHDNAMFSDCLISPQQHASSFIEVIYRARKNNQPVAAALKTTAPDGYNGKITLLVAVNIDGSVSGVRTLSHNETPGLGDKIETRKSDWITHFTGKKVLNESDSRWAVAKDGGMFDQFTGATITPRAVVKTVKNTVTYFKENQQMIFKAASNCGEEK